MKKRKSESTGDRKRIADGTKQIKRRQEVCGSPWVPILRKVEQAKSTERIGWIVGQTEASVDSLEKMRFRMMRKMRA
ncbi:hypothetical protein T10_6435 [Trichinella papuae]|uniref:Uncharacterized protein n=1 Tax=Trichinella papuae TaxID=268474 RepID=A0A0V1M591_9BILA|nr:hypothetical protein T10_6435 [Trichinella papuae]